MRSHEKIQFDFKLPMWEIYSDLIDSYNSLDFSTLSNEELTQFMNRVKTTRTWFEATSGATKTSMAAIYGASGTPIFDYFSNECAADTCGEGRYYCRLMNKAVNLYLSTNSTSE